MNIKLSEEQYRDLISLVAIGNFVLEELKYKHDEHESQANSCKELENHLIKYAKDFNCLDLKEKGDKNILREDFFDYVVDNYIQAYDNIAARSVLGLDFGIREFIRTMTKEEMGQPQGSTNFPDRLYKLCDHYQHEFDENGFENIVFVGKEKSTVMNKKTVVNYSFQVTSQMKDFNPKQVSLDIDSNSSLFDLAEKINEKVGLDFDHCFEFNNSFDFLSPNMSYETYDLFTDLYNEGEDVEPTNGKSVKKTKIKKVWKEVGDKMNYMYDYGSSRYFCVELIKNI